MGDPSERFGEILECGCELAQGTWFYCSEEHAARAVSRPTGDNMSESQDWWIHLTHPGGETSVSFHGTAVEAVTRGATYIGKPASWNCTKEPHTPNLWDTYTTARIEAVVALREEARPE